MARVSKKEEQKAKGVVCKDCKHAYGFHELDYKGEPFLCHCGMKGEYGRQFSEFIDVKHVCSMFEKKC